MTDILKDENPSNYEVAIALLKMHGEGHKKNGAEAWARDVLDSVSDIEAHVKALKSRNSSTLKELRKKVEIRKEMIERALVIEAHKAEFGDNIDKAIAFNLDWVLSEIDSLQQEGK